MASLLAEIHNIFSFLEAVFDVLAFTGIGAASLVCFAYELTTKRRTL